MKITLYTPDGEPLTYDNAEIFEEGGDNNWLAFTGTPMWILDSKPVRVLTSLAFLIHNSEKENTAHEVTEIFETSPLVQDNIPRVQ